MAASPGGQPPRIFLPQSARDLIELYFGTQLRVQPRESTPTATTTASKIDSWEHVRLAVTVCNNGTANVTLAFIGATLATAGVVLAAGQSVTWNWFLDGELAMRGINALASSGAQQLYVIESVLSGA
jgi:hypothetical protein